MGKETDALASTLMIHCLKSTLQSAIFTNISHTSPETGFSGHRPWQFSLSSTTIESRGLCLKTWSCAYTWFFKIANWIMNRIGREKDWFWVDVVSFFPFSIQILSTDIMDRLTRFIQPYTAESWMEKQVWPSIKGDGCVYTSALSIYTCWERKPVFSVYFFRRFPSERSRGSCWR